MSTPERRPAVTVEIAGEEYTLRADAPPEYTRRCAELVDETIREITAQAAVLESHKAVILAALSLADQLLQARKSEQERGHDVESLAAALRERIQGALAAGGATPDDDAPRAGGGPVAR